MGYESRIQKDISQRFKRGHFDLYLAEKARGERGRSVPDWELAERYLEFLKLLKKRLRLSGRIDIRLLAGVREVFGAEEYRATETAWEEMQQALRVALDRLEEMRKKEGRLLEDQIRGGLAKIEDLLESVISRWPEAKRAHQQRIRERVQEMAQGLKLEDPRMEQELALWAERWDITEECVRLQSHLQQARDLLVRDSPSGRPLDFLLQEMHREANTISSKASDAPISHQVIELKMELEKLREQAQNVE
jgi:uncharacterized protein (TIGR00255 family)